jgi:predicted nucleic acid-binding protein
MQLSMIVCVFFSLCFIPFTVYDASHLDLALRTGAPIATKDKALLIAMQTVGVDLVKP